MKQGTFHVCSSAQLHSTPQRADIYQEPGSKGAKPQVTPNSWARGQMNFTSFPYHFHEAAAEEEISAQEAEQSNAPSAAFLLQELGERKNLFLIR